MSFVPPTKTQKLNVIVEAAFGSTLSSDPATWVWTDISNWVRIPNDEPISLTGGAGNSASRADPSQIQLMLDNTDGRFTARNPSSPYWPNVVRNTPLRVSVTWDGAADTYELLTAFVKGWPIQPNAGLLDVTVPITATGRLRTQERSSKKVAASPDRYFSSLTGTVPLAGWTLEEGRLVSGGDPMFGGAQMRPFVGTHPSGAVVTRPQWGEGTLAPWLPPVVSRSGNSGLNILWGPVIMPANPTTWTIDIAYASTSDAQTSVIDVNPSYLGGSLGWPQLNFDPPNGEMSVSFNGLPEVVFDTTEMYDGLVHHIRWTATKSGTSTNWSVLIDASTAKTGTVTSFAPPSIFAVALTSTAGSAAIATGYLMVWTTAAVAADVTAAIQGHAGEFATDRVTRLCAENGVPVTVVDGTVNAQVMGPQGIDTFVNLVQQCADIDNGLLHDAGPSGSLVFVSGTARYNAPIAMTLDYERYHIGDGLASTYDDQDLVTEWVVSRTNGGTATVSDSEAADLYTQTASVDANSDEQLLQIGSWRVHLGTYDAYRLPSIEVDIRDSPELAQAATSLALPARISPANLPSPFPPESLDQFAEGFSIAIDSLTWRLALSCQPYGPWQVGIWGTSRYDSQSSKLSAGINATATSLSVATTNPVELWTTSAGDRPFDILVGGERMTVTNVTGSSSPQTFTVTRGVNGVQIAHAINTEVHLYQPAIVAL